MKKSSTTSGPRIPLNALVKSDLRLEIAHLAETERRSISAMTEILLDEALKARARQAA